MGGKSYKEHVEVASEKITCMRASRVFFQQQCLAMYLNHYITELNSDNTNIQSDTELSDNYAINISFYIVSGLALRYIIL